MKHWMKQLKFIVLISLIFVSILTACNKNQMKTIVIEENNEDKNAAITSKTKDGFKVKKIYKYNAATVENDNLIVETIIGWMDNENIAGIVNKRNKEGVVLKSINYKYHFKEDIMKPSSDVKISPNGKYLAYLKEEEPLKVMIEEVNTSKKESFLLAKIIMNTYNFHNFKWSNNSRYCSFSGVSEKSNAYNGYIYDIKENNLKEITLVGFESQPDIIISEDAAKALVTQYEGYNNSASMYLISLDKKSIDKKDCKKIVMAYDGYVKFIDANKFIFMDSSTDFLSMYNLTTDETIKIDNDVRYFNTSGDSKKIVYLKLSEQGVMDTYACRIEENEILNKEMIYRGFFAVNMFWSPDNKKILLYGESYNNLNIDYYEMVRRIYKEYINNEYIIVEFE